MTIAFSILSVILIIRELMFMKERTWFKKEREELINRIQAGTLEQYKQLDVKPGASVYKTLEQKVKAETSRLGITREDLQYPSHWKG